MYPKLANRVVALARRTEITENDWFELLRERAGELKEHLRNMTLKSLGELRIIHDCWNEHSLARDAPKILDDLSAFSLETRGIFPEDEGIGLTATVSEYDYTAEGRARIQKCERPLYPSTQKLWGLTRNGAWIGIEVQVVRSLRLYNEPDRYEEAAKAETVSIREMPLEELCAFAKRSPRQMWERFGDVAEDWVRDREILLSDARRLHKFFECEREVIKAIRQVR